MIYQNPNLFTWRQQYNPLRGFTVGRLIFLLEASERGIYSDLQWLYRFIEKRDATIRALVARRKSALEKLDWEIKIKEGFEDDARAKAQQDSLKGAYEMIDNLKQGITFLGSAEFRGFAHLEKHYNADGDVFHLEPVEQWYWARRMPKRAWLYNKRAQSTDNGFKIDPRNFIVREVLDPINEVAVICYLRKSMSLKDWDAFVETYGLPPIFIEMPETASVTNQDVYQDLANRIIGDMRGVLPPGAKFQTVPAESFASLSPFKEHIDYQDSQIVMAGTGGKLTMLNDPTGLGSGQSEVHSATFEEIAKAEAKQISEVFQKQFDSEHLRMFFPDEEPLVYFAIDSEDDVDVEQLVNTVVQLAGAGYRADVDELAEKTGLKLNEGLSPQEEQQSQQFQQGQEQQQNQQEKFAFRNRAQSHTEANTTKHVAEAFGRDMKHVRNRLNEILKIEDPEVMRDRMEALSGKLPSLLTDLNRDPAAAEPLGLAMSHEFALGYGGN